MKRIYFFLVMLFEIPGAWGQPIAAWDFTGLNNVATATATAFDPNLISSNGANTITRGPGANSSSGGNSFRTTGFRNDGISVANTDYFQVTLSAQPGYVLSLSAIDGFLNGTAGFAGAPGVANQFAYSLDGTNFTLLGSPSLTTVPLPVALPTVDLTGVPALQNVVTGTTITLRYYASGQSTTGGWGFFSSAAGVNGLAINGTLAGQALPVHFGNVKATQQSNGIKIEWSNLTELNVISYSIERSDDGRNFTSIGQANARLNNGGKADYSCIDAHPFNGANFYRIKSLETGSLVKYSIIVKVDIRGGSAQLVIYPNPSAGERISYQGLNLAKGKYAVRVFNAIGQQVYTKELNHKGGSVTESIPLPVVKAGMYRLQLSSVDDIFVKTFIVQ